MTHPHLLQIFKNVFLNMSADLLRWRHLDQEPVQQRWENRATEFLFIYPLQPIELFMATILVINCRANTGVSSEIKVLLWMSGSQDRL